jgi:hypothetical protein
MKPGAFAKAYSPKLVEGEFCELHLGDVLEIVGKIGE